VALCKHTLRIPPKENTFAWRVSIISKWQKYFKRRVCYVVVLLKYDFKYTQRQINIEMKNAKQWAIV